MSTQKPFYSGMAAIIGRPNVGKSTLMNALIGEKVAIVSNRPQTTRSRIMGVASGEGYQIVFLDTPGLHTPRSRLGEYMVKAAWDALDGVELVVMMIDASQTGPHDREIAQRLSARKEPKVMVLNKCDLIAPDKLLPLMDQFKDLHFDHIVPVSALSGEGLDKLTQVLVSLLPEGPRYFPEDMVTDQPERIICAEIIREKALLNLREEVPHGVGVEMMAITKLSESMTEIHATLYCEKASHKGIIIGKQGTMLQLIGSQARVDIERLLGTRVVLKLWVKVREDWRNRPDDLRTLGYD